jgi:ABC-type nitrate/sulfonate/bicarbonate transport system substrate-binding protein
MNTASPRRAGIAATAFAAAALLLTGCAATSSAADEEEGFGNVTLQLSWIKNEEFAGEFLADSRGYFEEAGFESVTLVPGPSTSVAELLSGSADIGLSDSVAAATAISEDGAPLKIIGATFQQNPFSLMSLAGGLEVREPEDMIGARIGVQDSNASLFAALLAANGIDESDVTVVPIQYDPSVLVNGDVDAMIGYISNEPITLEAQGYEVVQMGFAENGLPFVAETFLATDQTIAERREMLKAFLVAEIRGWSDAVADPEAGARLAVEEYGANLELVLEESIEKSRVQSEQLVVSPGTEANGLLTVTDELQDATITSLAGAGIDVTVEELFDLSLLAEVYEENPDLVDYRG